MGFSGYWPHVSKLGLADSIDRPLLRAFRWAFPRSTCAWPPAPPRAPSFGVIERQPPRPAAILLAMLAAAGILSGAVFGLGHSKARHFAEGDFQRVPHGRRCKRCVCEAMTKRTILRRWTPSCLETRRTRLYPRGGATMSARFTPPFLIRLPRFGDKVGLIPDTPSGKLLFRWLAAFNQASSPALEKILPNAALASTVGAQMDLRRQNGRLQPVVRQRDSAGRACLSPSRPDSRGRRGSGHAAHAAGLQSHRPSAASSLRAVVPAQKNVGGGVSTVPAR